jgi:hypothetical protein
MPSAPPLQDNDSEWNEPDYPRIPRLTQLKAKKKIYIRQIEVTLNGTPIDQVKDKVLIRLITFLLTVTNRCYS